jgi:hypothetical protein
MGEGGQRFVTNHCKNIGIWTVFCYNEGGVVEKLKNRVTQYVDVPLFAPLFLIDPNEG